MIESLCDEFIKLANSMRSNTSNDDVFNAITMTILTEKMLFTHLDTSTINIIEFLANMAEDHALNFQIDRNNLVKQCVNHPLTDNQRY